jgi:hypothetical protein
MGGIFSKRWLLCCLLGSSGEAAIMESIFFLFPSNRTVEVHSGCHQTTRQALLNSDGARRGPTLGSHDPLFFPFIPGRFCQMYKIGNLR